MVIKINTQVCGGQLPGQLQCDIFGTALDQQVVVKNDAVFANGCSP